MARGHRKGIPLEHLMHGMWQEVWATLEGNQTGMWQVMGHLAGSRRGGILLHLRVCKWSHPWAAALPITFSCRSIHCMVVRGPGGVGTIIVVAL